ncbi:MAG: FtsX-like permease family protein [Cytophagales bacterium]
MKNLNTFIARRINSGKASAFTPIVMRIAIGSVAIGIAIMVLSFCILEGFKSNIKDTILSFTGHMEITRFSLTNIYDNPPISSNSEIYKNAKSIPNVKDIQKFAYKAGLLKTDNDTKGVIMKGIDRDYNWSRFDKNIKKGKAVYLPDSNYSKEIMISESLSKLLLLDTGEEVLLYFIQEPVRTRKLRISGIYKTGLEDFDDNVIIGDLKLIQRLNNWNDSMVGGFELFISEYDNLDQTSEEVFELIDYSMQIELVEDKYPQIFEWMSLLNRNVALIIGIILVVATFNMIATLIVLIMERTNMIGVLKALGAQDSNVKRIFINNGLIIMTKGLFYGNSIALILAALQFYFEVIPLNADNYYMDAVPIQFVWPYIIGVNLLSALIIGIFLWIPVEIISRIKPVNAIKFS